MKRVRPHWGQIFNEHDGRCHGHDCAVAAVRARRRSSKEDTAAYDELLLRISTAVKPIDILDEICVRDYVDLTWEILRFRRLLIGFISASAYGPEKVWISRCRE
jgi:hypothetical protein